MKLLTRTTAIEVGMNGFDPTQLIKTTSNQLAHVGSPGQAAVKVDSKVADDVGWKDFCISKSEGTAVE